ncbi:MAG: CvpA family protein [Paracoccaceae bacterium]|jgi:membrane protein required for colicin V production
MEDYTLFDGGVAAILFISAVLAYSRGFVREILSIAGWIGAGIVAFFFAPQVVPLVQEIPILSEIIGDNCELGILAAFAGVFAIALVIIALFTPLISGAVQKSALGSLDGGLGFLFGLVRGTLLIVVVLISYDFFIAGGEGFPVVEDSKTRVILADQQERIQRYVPTELPSWLIDPYEELMSSCTGEAVEKA